MYLSQPSCAPTSVLPETQPDLLNTLIVQTLQACLAMMMLTHFGTFSQQVCCRWCVAVSSHNCHQQRKPHLAMASSQSMHGAAAMGLSR